MILTSCSIFTPNKVEVTADNFCELYEYGEASEATKDLLRQGSGDATVKADVSRWANNNRVYKCVCWPAGAKPEYCPEDKD